MMKKIATTFAFLVAVLPLSASCNSLKNQSYWFCHVMYSDVFGGCQPGATGDPRFDVLTEAWTMPECSDLHSDNRGYMAIRNPDEAQKTCMDRAYTKMLDRGLGTGPGEVGRVLFCMSLGSAEEMQKKMQEYAAKSRSPKGSSTCDPTGIEFDAETDTLLLPAGCTYAYLGADASENLDCNGNAACEPVEGESDCAACAKEKCCSGFDKCLAGGTSQNGCSCRFECEATGALDGCASCTNVYGDPAQDLNVNALAACLKTNCQIPNSEGANYCPLFLNY